MSLNIETIYLESSYENAGAVARIEHAEGLTKVGSGLYSQVFTSDDTPYVVKVMRGHDLGYLSYVKMVTELGDSPYLPKIQRIIHYRFRDDAYEVCDKRGNTTKDAYVFYMEKLEQPPRRGRCGIDWSDDRPHTVDRFSTTLSRLVNDALARELDWSKLRPKHQDLVALIALAYEQMPYSDYGQVVDIHGGNVMKRGKHFVVTDPIG